MTVENRHQPLITDAFERSQSLVIKDVNEDDKYIREKILAIMIH